MFENLLSADGGCEIVSTRWVDGYFGTTKIREIFPGSF